MTPEELSAAISVVLRSALDAGELGTADAQLPGPTVTVTRPKNRDHGDWATNVALQLGKKLGMAPRDLAGVLAARMAAIPGVAKVDVAGPGFLNVTLEAASAGRLAQSIVEAGAAYGRGTRYAGRRVNLEFVSANPTGPIHLGGTRWAAVGDSLARVLEANGAEVTREYYFNDHGTQIDRFARSLLARAQGKPAPEDGYGGQYIADIAEAVMAEVPDVLVTAQGEVRDDAEAQEIFRARGVQLMFAEIKKSLHDFGVDFDVYFHEQDLFDSGAVDAAVDRLKASGELYFADGAWWLKSTDFGDDKDRVVIKSDGNAAYIAGDLAYFQDKRARGFDLCIYMLGADHHGYIARLKAAASAFGDDPDTVEVLIGQLVNLMREGQPVRMSKRAGTVVTLEDLVEAVGVDAARYSLVRSSVDTSLNVDLDLLVKRTNDNPVFYVQYAHARTCAVDRRAAEAGVARDGGFDPALLADPTEAALLGHLGDFPRTVKEAGEFREPHRVARYLEALAGLYHKWYDVCRVLPVGEEPVTDQHRTRLWLNDAARQVLANGLTLLGVTAPERM